MLLYLHNMFLAWDRDHHMEYQLWENVDWSILNRDGFSEEVVDAMLDEVKRNLDVETSLPFWKILLITILSIQFRLGQVYWPKRFTGG